MSLPTSLSEVEHGTDVGYRAGCVCKPCADAHELTNYANLRTLRMKRDAARARNPQTSPDPGDYR